MPEDDGAARTPPLVLTEMRCSYHELVWLVSQLPLCLPGSTNGLPVEIVHRVAACLTVRRVVPWEVRALRATSDSGQHRLEASLDDTPISWWISGPGSMPLGRGEQFVEYGLGNRLRRLKSFSIQIPPLPMGPLSVRTLRLEASATTGSLLDDDDDDDSWSTVSPVWTVENRTGWQDYELPAPVDAQRVRVVCLTNQMSLVMEQIQEEMGEHNLANQFDSVGYYCVKFE